MQYFRLSDKYILRGWKKLPYAVVDTSTGNPEFLSAQKFQALELCDGSLESSFIPQDFMKTIADFEQRGIVEKCEAGNGLTDYQHYKKYPSRYIRSVQWSITGKCNYKCRHCYMSAPEPSAHQLPHEDIMRIIDQLAECGVMRVQLTGGEPLIRPDFFEILDALAQRNIIIEQIYSNGALVDEALLHELSKHNFHPTFVMSFDGAGWHDWMRGVKGAEENVLRAFELCRDRGFQTLANMAIHRGNMHTLRETVNLLAGLGVAQIKTSYATSLGEWKSHSDGQEIGIKEVLQTYLDYLPSYFEDGMPIALFFTPFLIYNPAAPDQYKIIVYDEAYDPDETLLCGHARSNAYISPEGRAVMCGILAGLEFEKKYPLLSDMSFAECIDTPEYMHLVDMRASDFLKANDECRNCKFVRHCYGGCRGAALADNDENLMGKNPMLCEIYYGGWIKKLVDTMKKYRPSAECPVKDEALL